MQGGFLGSNPYLDQMANSATDSIRRQYKNTVMPGINATFGGAGRTGSKAHEQALYGVQANLAHQLGNATADLYGNAYDAERGRMLQTQAMAPQLAATDYTDINAVQRAGERVDQQAQNLLNDQVARFDHYQNLPDQQLQQYIAAIQGNYGGQASTSTSGGPSKSSRAIAQGLGGAASGAALGAQFGSVGGPWGAAIGGLLGAGAAYL